MGICPPQLMETSSVHHDGRRNWSQAFIPQLRAAFLAGMFSGTMMEQLLIHLGQSQHCLMATPVMAKVSWGYRFPSGAGPTEALSFLPLVAPSWDLGCSHHSWGRRTPWKTI